MESMLVRKVPGLPSGGAPESISDSGCSEGRAAPDGAQWVHDIETRSAQSITPITASGTAFAAQSPPVVFRALRFDTAGTVIFTATGATGSQTRNVAAGEVWSASSSAILSITGGTSTVIDGLG